MLSSVKAQLNSCKGALNVRIQGSESNLPMQVDYIKSDLYCTSVFDGYIKILAIGGTEPYTFKWEDGNTQQERYDLAPGSYSVTIHDSSNCIDTMHINLQTMVPGQNDLYLADEWGCGNCYLKDGTFTFIYQDVDFMINVTDPQDGLDLGTVETCLDVLPKAPKFQDRLLLCRNWTVKTSKNRARIRFYFRSAELEQLAVLSGYKSILEVIDTADINITVFKGGTSSYDNYDFMQEIPREQFVISKSEVEDVWVAVLTYSDFEPNAFTGFYLSIKDINISTNTEEEVVKDSSRFYLLQNPVFNLVELTSENFNDYVDGIVKIIDVDGRLLHKEKFYNTNLKSQKVRVTDYPSGAYFFVLEIPKKKIKQSFKFIKL